MDQRREGLTRRDALRVGGASVVVLGAAAAGCDPQLNEPDRDGSHAVGAPGGSVAVFPVPGTPTVSAQTSISFRGVTSGDVGEISVKGSGTGKHSGKLREHPDGKGVTFVPAEAFEPGEKITVQTELDVHGATKGDFFFGVARPFEPPDSDAGESGEKEAVSAGVPDQVRTFTSQPELHPPKLEVVEPAAGSVAAGYVFIAPKKPRKDNTQEGPMIVDNDGQVVWFHPLESGTEAMDFKVQTYRGKKVLTWWEGHVGPGYGVGEYVIADDTYQEVTRVTAGNGYAGDLHEFRVTSRGTALFTIYSPVSWDESPGRGGSPSEPVIDSVFQEVDVATGAVLFEWHSLGNVDLDETYGDPIPAKSHDYIHHNSIEVDRDGNFLLSGRHTRTVYKIDSATGVIIWRLGGKKSDFTMGQGTEFAYQHDVQREPDGTLTIFDNAAGSPETAVRKISRGIVVKLNMEAMSATLVREYKPPEEILAESQANIQTLHNGNVFIGWGNFPGLTEYTKDGSVLFDMRFPSDVESYRAFRFPWKGRPTSRPALAVESRDGGDGGNRGEGRGRGDGGAVTVAASWNGATEVAAWQVLAGPSARQLKPAGKQKRGGFETRIKVPGKASHVAVRALDASGNALGTSPVTATGR